MTNESPFLSTGQRPLPSDIYQFQVAADLLEKHNGPPDVVADLREEFAYRVRLHEQAQRQATQELPPGYFTPLEQTDGTAVQWLLQNAPEPR